MAVIHYRFHFKFFLPLNQVWGWSRVIGPVLTRFVIRGQQTCMEYVMDGPGRGESESISDGRNLFHDEEWAVAFRGQLERLIREG